MTIDDYLMSFSQELLKKIDVEDTHFFNDILKQHDVVDNCFDSMHYELKSFTVYRLEDVFEVLDALSSESSRECFFQESGLISLFVNQYNRDSKKYQSTYFYFFDMIANGRPEVMALATDESEYLFLEKYCTWGGVRILKYDDKIRMLTLSEYD